MPAGVSNSVMFQLDYYFVCNSLFKRSIFKQATSTRVVLRTQCYGDCICHFANEEEDSDIHAGCSLSEL